MCRLVATLTVFVSIGFFCLSDLEKFNFNDVSFLQIIGLVLGKIPREKIILLVQAISFCSAIDSKYPGAFEKFELGHGPLEAIQNLVKA
jgi:hypothetical protein